METEKKSFSLSSFAYADESDVEIIDIHGHKTGWVWTIAGPGHPLTVAADRKNSDAYLKRERSKEAAQVNNRKWKSDDENAAELLAINVDYLVARTLRWSATTMDGADFPCTPDNARKMLSMPGGVFYRQINDFTKEEQSFIPRSAGT